MQTTLKTMHLNIYKFYSVKHKIGSFSILVFFFSLLLPAKSQNQFIIGQDLSYANMMEDCGAVFMEDDTEKDIFQIFADNGTNLVRVRLWHNPDWQESISQPEGVNAQYNNFEDAKKTILRAKNAGMQVMLGFQFSDFWCDPGRQIVPKAWEGVSGSVSLLADSVYNYVTRILTALEAENLMPEYVKIGNENNGGIMTYMGMDSNYDGITALSSSWSRHATLFNAAISAVRDISEQTTIKPKIVLHVADPSKAEYFYNNVISNGITDFDVMGFSYYYSFHGQSPSQVGEYISLLKNQHPDYEAMVVETGYLWTDENIDQLGNIISTASSDYLPISPGNQQKFMVDLSEEVENAGGSGVIFWEPDWVSTPCSTPWGTGSSYENVAFFDFDNNLNFMKNGAGGWPDAFLNKTPTSVDVTFKVDMTGQDVSNGVYIVGQMTSWEFIQMQLESGSVYSTSFTLTPGDIFAYYFITSNTWTNYEQYRETVPEACALSDELLNDPEWTTDRAFKVPVQDTTIAYYWASCETFETAISTPEIKPDICVYPNPLNGNILTIESSDIDLSKARINLIAADGKIITPANTYIITSREAKLNLGQIENGIYMISVSSENKQYYIKVSIR